MPTVPPPACDLCHAPCEPDELEPFSSPTRHGWRGSDRDACNTRRVLAVLAAGSANPASEHAPRRFIIL